MRVAIVSPYSWTYPGGVNRHVDALAGELIDRRHEVRVLAPWDPPGRLSRALHRGAPESREIPEYLVPLARTVGIGANGSVSNLCVFPEGVVKLRRELRAFDPDVVHVHEPPGFLVGTLANDSGSVLLVIGTIYLAITAGFFWATAGEVQGATAP